VKEPVIQNDPFKVKEVDSTQYLEKNMQNFEEKYQISKFKDQMEDDQPYVIPLEE
jgi:hypothetical protein